MPGTTSPTIRPARAPTAGARTGWRASPTTGSCSASPWRCGTARIPILKERLFGLTNSEGNHGEDVKEYYFYLDSHADPLVHEVPLQVSAGGLSVRRSRRDQPAPGPARARVRAARHGRLRRRIATSTCSSSTPRRPPRTSSSRSPSTTAARSRRRCTCCRRSGSATRGRGAATRPGRVLRQMAGDTGGVIAASHPELGERFLCCEGAATLLFTENETNTERLFGVAQPDALRQGRDQRLRRPRPAGGGESREDRDEGGGPLSPDGGGRGIADRPAAALSDPRAQRSSAGEARPVRRRLRRGDAGAPAGGGRVLRGGHSLVARLPMRPT